MNPDYKVLPDHYPNVAKWGYNVKSFRNSQLMGSGGERFNASIVEWKGELLMSYRCYSPVHGRTVVGISRLDDKLEPHDKVILNLPSKGTRAMTEDARLFVFKDSLYVSYTEIDHSVIPQWHATMRLAKLREDFSVEHIVPLNYGSNPMGIEKNWIFFEDGGNLNFIYDLRKSHVVQIHEKTGRVKNEWDSDKIFYPYGILRGGSVPTKWDDDHLIGFYHTSTDFPWLERRYALGAFIMLSKAPYTIVKISKAPLVFGSRENLFCGSGNGKCIFPCGHIERNNSFLVACGVNDTFNCIIQIPREKIEETLINSTYYHKKHMKFYKGPKSGIIPTESGDKTWVPIRVGRNLESVIATDDIRAISMLIEDPDIVEITEEEYNQKTGNKPPAPPQAKRNSKHEPIVNKEIIEMMNSGQIVM